MTSETDQLIGYTAYDPDEEIYEYVENSCFIADSEANVRKFTENCWKPAEVYKTEPVRLSDILKDFGASGGLYAMEAEALKRFINAAEASGIRYKSEPYGDTFTGLFSVDTG
jgi:hypothetical protein